MGGAGDPTPLRRASIDDNEQKIIGRGQGERKKGGELEKNYFKLFPRTNSIMEDSSNGDS